MLSYIWEGGDMHAYSRNRSFFLYPNWLPHLLWLMTIWNYNLLICNCNEIVMCSPDKERSGHLAMNIAFGTSVHTRLKLFKVYSKLGRHSTCSADWNHFREHTTNKASFKLYYYINTSEIPGFFLLLKVISSSHTVKILFLSFTLWRYYSFLMTFFLCPVNYT